MEQLKNLVSSYQLKKANLSGNETVRPLNIYAKCQKNHRQNKKRRIFDEKGQQTEFVLKATAKQTVIIKDLETL